jgi:hypothetical protein
MPVHCISVIISAIDSSDQFRVAIGLEIARDVWLGVPAGVTIGFGNPFFLFGDPAMSA